MKNHRKLKLRKLLPVIGILAGIAILSFYPLSDLYYSIRHSLQKKEINQAVSQISKEDKAEYLRQADLYNNFLITHIASEEILSYEAQLSVNGEDQPFATLTIPKISLTIPVYHGTETETLANGAGHLKGSSLPVGGKSTHAVITAHSGMKGMRAFDDIRELKSGDEFWFEVLGKKVAYRVYSTETVWPKDVMDRIKIEKDLDLCTLVTCTPYGINDHRLLVHAKRCRYPGKDKMQRPSVKEIVTNRRIWPLEAACLLAVLLILPYIIRKIRRRKKCRKRDKV